MATARYYVPENNPDEASLPGVPLADISEEQWDTLPGWLQASVDASPAYRKTAPPKGKAQKEQADG